MADRPDHDLADRPTELLAELLHHRATQNAIVRSYGIMPSSRAEDDDLDRAAAARLRQLTDDNERLRELAGFLIDACATHRIDVPINSSLLDLAADIWCRRRLSVTPRRAEMSSDYCVHE